MWKSKMMVLIILGVFCFSFTACSNSGLSDTKTGTFHNIKTGTEITLDMSRAEIEKLLPPWGESMPEEFQEQSLYWPVTYGSTSEEIITVCYASETDTVVQIQLDKNEDTDTQWSLAGGVTIGSSLEKILDVYGPAPQANPEQTFLNYFYDADGGLVKENTRNAAYSVTFVLNEDGLESCCVMSTAFDSKPVDEPAA